MTISWRLFHISCSTSPSLFGSEELRGLWGRGVGGGVCGFFLGFLLLFYLLLLFSNNEVIRTVCLKPMPICVPFPV